MVKEAIILAGGMGTRLRPVIGDIPKAMAIIDGQPFLNYVLNYLQLAGIEKIILSISQNNQSIIEHCGNAYRGLQISYSIEENPLGTGGAIYKAMGECNSKDVLIVNGDTLFNLDVNAFYEFHFNHKSHFTLGLKESNDPGRFGSVFISDEFRILSFEEKGSTKKTDCFINGGSYLFNKKAFLDLNFKDSFSIEKDFFEKKVDEVDFYGFVSKDYFIDIGVPEDFKRAQNEFKQYKI